MLLDNKSITLDVVETFGVAKILLKWLFSLEFTVVTSKAVHGSFWATKLCLIGVTGTLLLFNGKSELFNGNELFEVEVAAQGSLLANVFKKNVDEELGSTSTENVHKIKYY